MPAYSSTSQAFAHESARRRGGETWAANGLSDVRTVFRVIIAAEGDRGGDCEAAVERARRISASERGEPVTTVRPGRGARLLEVRTRATAVWSWERSSDTTCCPVRPLAPRRRKCMAFDDDEGCSLRTRLLGDCEETKSLLSKGDGVRILL